MSFLTGLALRRRSVTILVAVMVLAGGVLTYRSLPVELFPEIAFPLVTVSTFYPSANPDAVVRDVTEPIENAISGMSGLKDVQAISFENRSLVLANFDFGTDMEEAERSIASNVNSIRFPAGVEQPRVGRINPDAFPVLQLSVLGDRDIPALQRIVNDLILPEIEQVDGVFSVDLIGEVDEQVLVTVDTDSLEELGLSMLQVSNALLNNNLSFPAGTITEQSRSFNLRTTHEYAGLDEIRDLVVGFERSRGPREIAGTGLQDRPIFLQDRPILLSDIAEVRLGTAAATTISRTNGKPSLGIAVIKGPDANTVEVTTEVLKNLDRIEGLPPDIEIVTISNDGPQIKGQLDTLQREGVLGFLFAMTVVFAFLITLRPTLIKGVALTLRPTFVIGLSIPLSIFTGIVLMGMQGLSLNFMTLGGLAIAVGRVVDDSIVVLENLYRHIQRGEERFTAALDATREVAGAIAALSLTAIVVFFPLAFIQGLVGAFFLPLALAVTFALVASLVVALTVVPVVGALVLRKGDFPEVGRTQEKGGDGESGMQRAYIPALLWSLRHKFATLLIAFFLTVGSLALTSIIPIALFAAGPPLFIRVDVELPFGSSVGRTFAEVLQVEEVLAGLQDRDLVKVYQSTIGSPEFVFGGGSGSGGFDSATIIGRLTEEAPVDLAESLRTRLARGSETTITVTEVSGEGPPQSGLEVTITGNDYGVISAVARQLESALEGIDGIINISSDVTQAKKEIVITVRPNEAAEFGLTTSAVAQQVNQYIVGRPVTEVALDGITMNVVLRGPPEDVAQIDKVRALKIEGPSGSVRLASIADVAIKNGPVSISRINGERSAAITGTLTAQNVEAIRRAVEAMIDAIQFPPGVKVKTGGVFEEITEGFQAIFQAMGISVILVYLVMVASTGSLRNPFVIIMSLPLATIGALVALAVTGRTLGLPAMMGLLLLIGIVVTNAIVLIAFVQQLREGGMNVHDALVEGGRVRLRPILMTAFTTIFALIPLAASAGDEGGIIGAELATVVIGGLVSSTFLTLIVVPVVYTIMHVSLPGFIHSIRSSPIALAPSSPGSE